MSVCVCGARATGVLSCFPHPTCRVHSQGTEALVLVLVLRPLPQAPPPQAQARPSHTPAVGVPLLCGPTASCSCSRTATPSSCSREAGQVAARAANQSSLLATVTLFLFFLFLPSPPPLQMPFSIHDPGFCDGPGAGRVGVRTFG